MKSTKFLDEFILTFDEFTDFLDEFMSFQDEFDQNLDEFMLPVFRPNNTGMNSSRSVGEGIMSQVFWKQIVALLAVIFVFGFSGTGIKLSAQNTGQDDDPWGFSKDGTDGTDTGFDTGVFGSGVDDAATPAPATPITPATPVTVPATPGTPVTTPAATSAPAIQLQIATTEAERERLRREEAARKARPKPGDGIQITFDRREQQELIVDPNLKRAGESIIYNPQIYNEYRNPGGFQFRGILGAWPQDEYLVDGGDDWLRAHVRGNWEIRGLEPENTIVHYDTLDNKRLVEASNRVAIYSPRFASVRKVDGAVSAIEWQHYAGAQSKTAIAGTGSRMNTGSTAQNETSGYARSNILPRSANAGANTGEMALRTSPMTYQNGEVTASLSQLLTHATFSAAEIAYLAEAKRAAVAWAGIDHLEVRVGEQTAQAMIGQKTPEAVYTLEGRETTAKLRLFKVASKETARRGEIVEFMIRFDNIGSETVGNITIVDSLTARLEYITGSAGSSLPAMFSVDMSNDLEIDYTPESSVPAEFFIEPNEAGSHILRWEITNPLEPGDFGVVRFRCRVQ